MLTHSDGVKLTLVGLRLLLASERQRRQRRRDGRPAGHVGRLRPPAGASAAHQCALSYEEDRRYVAEPFPCTLI